MLTLRQAVKLSGVSRSTLGKAIKTGKLRAETKYVSGQGSISWVYQIEESELQRYLENRQSKTKIQATKEPERMTDDEMQNFVNSNSRSIVEYFDEMANRSIERTAKRVGIGSYRVCEALYLEGRFEDIYPSFKRNLDRKYQNKIQMESPTISSQKDMDSDGEILEKFFDNLGGLMDEIKELRKERDEWKRKAMKWSAQIIELQNLVGRPS